MPADGKHTVGHSEERKPDEVKNFEAWYYSAKDNDRLKGYSDFRNTYTEYDPFILQNPFIDIRYHDWYGKLGL